MDTSTVLVVGIIFGAPLLFLGYRLQQMWRVLMNHKIAIESILIILETRPKSSVK